MSLYLLEKLKNGETDFLELISLWDFKYLTEQIKKLEDRSEIINQIYDKIKDSYPAFCFRIIYDIDEYSDKANYLLGKSKVCRDLDGELLKDILYNTSYGKDAVLNNLEGIIICLDERLKIILDYLYVDYESNLELIEKISKHDNLHIRYLYLKYLIDNGKDDYKHEDISQYLVKYNENTNEFEFMEQYDVTRLSYMFFENGNKEEYLKLKEFILKNYKHNSLAELFITDGRNNPACLEEFKSQADEFFITSSSYQYQIYCRYREYISEEIINNFLRYYDMFRNSDIYSKKLAAIFRNELWHDLVTSVDKYLSLSKDTSHKYMRSGSCSDVYRVGDYIFKLCNKKYNQTEIICPSNYLILKNLEECFSRDYNGWVLAGFEVQKYLTRSAREIPEKLFDKFNDSLLELGYVYEDYFFSDKYGDNCMLLDSYRDADCSNPESLPDWFKEYPVVIVDRDLFVKKKI